MFEWQALKIGSLVLGAIAAIVAGIVAIIWALDAAQYAVDALLILMAVVALGFCFLAIAGIIGEIILESRKDRRR